MKMKLGGDWAPQFRKVEPLPWRMLLLANLEGPILESLETHTPAVKAGPHVANGALPEGVAACVLSLANNHLMDFGEQGRRETEAALRRRGLHFLGAGSTAKEAAAPVIVDWDGVRVGVLSRCEEQFGVATHMQPGVAALNPAVHREIRELKRNTDLVIVSVHAAAEMCPWPAPRRQDSWRALIAAGADIVHGHHAHVPQGWEAYGEGFIFYGLGNLCVDPKSWSKHTNTLWSLAPECFWGSGKIDMRATTAVIEERGDAVRVRDATPDEAQSHHQYLEICNQPLTDRGMLEALWQEFSLRIYRTHYAEWLRFEPGSEPGHEGLRRIAGQFSAKARSLLRNLRGGAPRQDQYLLWYHLFACESHADAIATALGVLGGALDDQRSAETARLVDAMMPASH